MKTLWMAALLAAATAVSGCQGTVPVQPVTQVTDGGGSQSFDSDSHAILLIGDSISDEYAPYVQEALPCVKHSPGNSHDTETIIANMSKWMHEKHYHIIHVNAGLWDISHRSDLSTRRDKLYDPALAPITTTKAEYAANVGRIMSFLQGRADIVLWATTTDVPDNSIGRERADVPPYNAIAIQVAAGSYGAPIDDLYTLMLPHEGLHHLQNINKVHYNDKGARIMAAHVIDTLKAYGGCN